MSEFLTPMNSETFLKNYPEKPIDAYKGMHGRTLLIGGSYGMAGAVCLNILGAQAAGSDYICCALDDSIYPVAASRFLTPVFFPLTEENWKETIRKALNDKITAVAFGSGIDRLPYKQELLVFLLLECSVPLLLDAGALQLIAEDKGLLKNGQCPLILTPHIGEFAALCNKSIAEISEDRSAAALAFAKEYNVTLVLKGPQTIIADPEGRLTQNNSGNPALAQAGSGDLLSGITAGMLTLVRDPFTAVSMAVWLHGHLADRARRFYSAHVFPLEVYPQLMNAFLLENGR